MNILNRLPTLVLPILLLLLSACAAVPTVKLKPEALSRVQQVRLVSAPDNNYMLHSVSTVDVQFLGVGFAFSPGDGKGVREFTLEYMDQHQLSLNELVRSQFKARVEADGIAMTFTDDAPNKLVLTLNIVVLAMRHGFSDEFNALFNISGQLINSNGEVMWSYNAIPMPPAPGYPATLAQMFASPEALQQYLAAASEPMVQKLYNHFKSGLN